MTEMTTEETYETLGAACLCVSRAIDELLRSDLAPASCSGHLEQGAELLLAVQESSSLPDDRDRIRSLLRDIATQSETAMRLLESAATSYIGSILSNQVCDAGYTPEGAPERLVTGLSLVMEA